MRKARSWITLVLAVAAPGCNSDPTGPEAQEQLLGSWTWVEATGGIAGETRTPASTGETMTLRFLPGGGVELHKNGRLELATAFTLETADDGGTTLIRYVTPPFGFEVQTVVFPDRDTLILIDDCCDGFTYRFTRAP